MDDWAVGNGMAAAFQPQHLRERSQNDINNLFALKKQMETDDLNDEAAQVRYAEYQKKVSDFSDKLLAPDRQRINKKAEVLSQKVREELRTHGGDMSKFMASGGHMIMEDYYRGVVNSDEANKYLGNKKNMDLLVAAMSSPDRDLIPEKDLENFRKYGETGDGEISYSGLMNRIKLPDSEAYGYGQDIPAKDILNANRAAITGNFKMLYPDADANEFALEVFTQQNYGGKGKNWQRDLAIKKEQDDHIEALAKAESEALKEFYKSNKKGKTYTDAEGNEIQVDEATGDVIKNPDQKDYKGQGGYTRIAPVEIQNAVATFKGKKLADIQAMKDVPKEIADISQPIADGELSRKNLNRYEKGLLWDDNVPHGTGGVYDLINTVYDDFQPSKARRIYQDLQMDVAKVLIDGDTGKSVDIANKKVVGYQPNAKSFWVDGTQVQDNDDKINSPMYKGDYAINDIVLVNVGKNAKTGKDAIMMDLMDGKKPHKKNVEKQKAIFGESTINQKMAIMLENDKGEVFYELYDPMDDMTVNKLRVGLGAKADLAPISEDNFNRNNGSNANKKETAAKELQLQTYWDKLEGNKEVFKNVPAEAMHYSSTGQYTGKRDLLFKSYYGGITQVEGMNELDQMIQVTHDPEMSLSNHIKDYDEKGFKFRKPDDSAGTLKEMISDGKYTDDQIVQTLINWSERNKKAEDLPYLRAWYDNLQYLKRKRTAN